MIKACLDLIGSWLLHCETYVNWLMKMLYFIIQYYFHLKTSKALILSKDLVMTVHLTFALMPAHMPTLISI